jgi:hypothetical protein
VSEMVISQGVAVLCFMYVQALFIFYHKMLSVCASIINFTCLIYVQALFIWHYRILYVQMLFTLQYKMLSICARIIHFTPTSHCYIKLGRWAYSKPCLLTLLTIHCIYSNICINKFNVMRIDRPNWLIVKKYFY